MRARHLKLSLKRAGNRASATLAVVGPVATIDPHVSRPNRNKSGGWAWKQVMTFPQTADDTRSCDVIRASVLPRISGFGFRIFRQTNPL
jgi:hypothetical protein